MRVTKVNKHNYFVLKNNTEYDLVAELAVSSYNLDVKGRKEKMIDMKQCLVKWWEGNNKKFYKYRSMTNISKLLKCHHTTVNHLQKHRIPSLRYNENTECIKDFLTS